MCLIELCFCVDYLKSKFHKFVYTSVKCLLDKHLFRQVFIIKKRKFRYQIKFAALVIASERNVLV